MAYKSLSNQVEISYKIIYKLEDNTNKYQMKE